LEAVVSAVGIVGDGLRWVIWSGRFESEKGGGC